MLPDNLRPVRLYFEKSGPARFISHLDLLRCFERSLRRADIPFWYTEGFNPRPFMSFAQPLSLGTVGLREVVDIRLLGDISFETVIDRLNAVMPEGIIIREAVQPKKKVNDITASRYHITFEPTEDNEALCAALNAFLSQESIVIQKLNKKKKPVESDLKRFVHNYSAFVRDGCVVLDITLSSGCTENCNPSLLLSTFFEQTGAQPVEQLIVRKLIMTADGREFA